MARVWALCTGVVVLGSWRARSERTESLTALAQRLTDRDREIISDLGRLRVLTLEQIARVHFASLSSARDRMATLVELGVVDRFRPGTRGAFRFVLSWSGMRLHHAAVEEARLAQPEFYREGTERPRAAPSRPAAEAHLARLIANPARDHLEGVNDFYSRLAAACRTAPEVELVRWYSETEATALLNVQFLRPDGAARLTVAGVEWLCWFEHDTGTEPAGTLVRKASTYRAQLSGKTIWLGHHHAVSAQCLLFELTRPGREAGLHPALAEHADGLAIATSATERSGDPLGPVWRSAGDPVDRLRPLVELPAREPGERR